ncbi:hypothetical protein PITCH_A230004 [uncultured Desulfobacterium sp.]|uniref:Uncharacterized protein n=1 Tax=uncultured Desulfobacterium sp. TaxID=201089 RepID=A0A445MXX4_9BACT|nr:hypothetical protein PITCH_A230004 [uncultured Desulfobacterium sp.]
MFLPVKTMAVDLPFPANSQVSISFLCHNNPLLSELFINLIKK